MSILSINPAHHIFIDYPHTRANTFGSNTSSNQTVCYHGQCRTFSGSSFASASSTVVTPCGAQAFPENVRPLRTVQSTTYTKRQRPTLRKVVSQLPSRTLWSAEASSPQGDGVSLERPATPESCSTLANDNLEDRVRTASLFDGFDSIAELNVIDTVMPQGEAEPNIDSGRGPESTAPIPFKKWLGTLRRRRELPGLTELTNRIPIDGEDHDSYPSPYGQEAASSRPRASTVESSTRGFVTAVKSATVTLAESSIAPKSWLGNLSKQLHRGRHSRSNTVDSTGSRSSMNHGIDEFAMSRARQRRLILEELIETEESYVADLKVLQNAGIPYLHKVYQP